MSDDPIEALADKRLWEPPPPPPPPEPPPTGEPYSDEPPFNMRPLTSAQIETWRDWIVGIAVIGAIVVFFSVVSGALEYSLMTSSGHSAPSTIASYWSKQHCERAAMEIEMHSGMSAWCIK